jgi:hypothetical protein
LGNMIELLVRLAISMAVVMAVMGLAARFVRRRQESGLGSRGLGTRRPGKAFGAGYGRSAADGVAAGGPGAGSPVGAAPNTLGAKLGGLLGAPRPRRARPIPPVEVVYRRALAKGASVAVVEATGKQFLLGVTEQSITLLAELPSFADGMALDADVPAPTSRTAPTSGPTGASSPAFPQFAGGSGRRSHGGRTHKDGTRADNGASGTQVSELEVWDELDDLQQADRMPASPTDAASLERQNAWKLTLDSLRERTIRR